MDAVKIYEDAVKKLDRSEITLGEFEQMIAPLRNVIQPKYGKWIYIKMASNGLKICECDMCHRRTYGSGNFCSNCGADMRGEAE